MSFSWPYNSHSIPTTTTTTTTNNNYKLLFPITKYNLLTLVAPLVLTATAILYNWSSPSFTSQLIIILIIILLLKICQLTNHDNHSNLSIATHAAKTTNFLETWCYHFPQPSPTQSTDTPKLEELEEEPKEIVKDVVITSNENPTKPQLKNEYDYDDDDIGSDFDEPSIDDAWKAITEGRKVLENQDFKKSTTWEMSGPSFQFNDISIAHTETSKIVLKTESKTTEENKSGRRRRDALIMSEDQLFHQAEMLIKKHRLNLRLQRLESEENRKGNRRLRQAATA